MRTEIVIRATRTQNVLGEKGRIIRELTSVVQKRFNFPLNSVELYAEKLNNRGSCAIAQAEYLRYKLLGGLAVRRYMGLAMVIVSGKLRAQCAKSMKIKDGYMISSGQPVKEHIDSAVRHVLLKQGVLGIKVRMVLDWDPKGNLGPMTPLPDLDGTCQKKKTNISATSTCRSDCSPGNGSCIGLTSCALIAHKAR